MFFKKVTKLKNAGLVLVILALLISGCGESDIPIDSAGLSERHAKLAQIHTDIIAGKASFDEGRKRASDLGSEFLGYFDSYQARRFPDWAEKLGLHEPTGCLFLDSLSSATDLESHKFRSIQYVYQSDYDHAHRIAFRIAGKLKLALALEYKLMYDAEMERKNQLRKEGKSAEADTLSMIKGAVFSNYTPGQLTSGTAPEFTIDLTLEQSGVFRLTVTEYKKMLQSLNK